MTAAPLTPPRAHSRRADPLELLFDVVYAFAFIQVSHLMAEPPIVESVLEGVAVFGVLWWTWALFTWLSNQHGVDRRSVRIGTLVSTVAVFVTALAIPSTFSRHGEHVPGALVFAVGFLATSVAWVAASMFAARGNGRLTRQVLLTAGGSLLPVSALLIAGSLVGEELRIILWLAAVALQGAGALATSVRGEWRLPAPEHFAERHQLIVILALGESVISVGSVAADAELNVLLLVAAGACIVLTVAVWYSYFRRLAGLATSGIASRGGLRRAMLGTGGTYLHLGIVFGVLLIALGARNLVEQMIEHRESDHTAAAMFVGVAMFLLATAIYSGVLTHRVPLSRLAAMVAAIFGAVAATYIPAAFVPGIAALLCVAGAIGERPKITIAPGPPTQLGVTHPGMPGAAKPVLSCPTRTGATSDAKDAMMTTEDRDTVVADWIDAANARDTERYLEYFTADAILDDPSVGRTFEGREGIERYFRDYFIGYNTTTVLTSIATRGDVTHVEVEFSGDFPEGQVGGMFDISFTGERFSHVKADLIR